MKEFIREQDEFRSMKLISLQRIEAEVHNIIEKSCDEYMLMLSEANKTHETENVNEEQEIQDALIKTHQKKLRRFITFIDHRMMEAKMKMLTNSTRSLLDMLRLHNKSEEEKVRTIEVDQPMIVIDAWFSGAEVTYHPSNIKLIRLFENTVAKGIALIFDHHRQFLYDSAFSVYEKTRDSNECSDKERIDVQLYIKGHKEQNELIDRVKEELQFAFRFVSQESTRLVPLLEIYREGRNVSSETYKRKNTGEIIQALNRFKNQYEELLYKDVRRTSEQYCCSQPVKI